MHLLNHQSKFHRVFIEKVRPEIFFPASKTDNEFITTCFMNRSPNRLTRLGLQYANSILRLPKVTAKLSLVRSLSPNELRFIHRQTDDMFYLDEKSFTSFDPSIMAYLTLANLDMEIFLQRGHKVT
jgi:hypothetical protein